MSTELPIVDEARGYGVRPGPLRAAFAASLVLHACGFYWVLARGEAAAPERALRSFEVTLARAPLAVAAPPLSRPAPEISVPEAQPEQEKEKEPDSESESERPALPRMAAPERPSALVPAPLDLSLPADVVRPDAAPERAGGVFDPELAQRIGAVRAARRGPAPEAGPRSWTLGAGDRTRIETESGCFERVRDAFDDQPGEQWWMVACSSEAEIDWGARFRARP